MSAIMEKYMTDSTRLFSTKACGSKSKTNFQKMLYAPEAEHVTSLALQKLLADLRAEHSNLSADMFLKIRQEVLHLSLRELTETVVLFRDRLEVTLSKSIADRLDLKKTVCVSYPIKTRSVGKRNKTILSEAPLNTPNQELILCVAKSWKWYHARSLYCFAIGKTSVWCSLYDRKII